MKARIIYGLSVIIVFSATLNGCKKTSPEPSDSAAVDPALFTTAEPISLPGCGNLYKVSDVLYRGEQPTAEGFKELEKLGIKTVVNLRSLHSDRDKLEGTGLGYEHIRMEAWDPEPEQVKAFLEIVTNPEKQPVFVHCMHGSDRTGTMVAVYRMVIEGWDTEKSLDEMRNGPFGFHEIWTGLPEFIQKIDIKALQEEFPTMR
jgi:protein tyrosine/serine phosphatase